MGRIDIVNAHQRNILGNPDALLLKGPHGSDGCDIVAAEHRAYIRFPLKEKLGSPVSVLGGELHIRHPGRPLGNPSGSQGIAVAQIALLVCGFANIADAAVPQAYEMLCGSPPCLAAVADYLVVFASRLLSPT